MDPDCQRFIKGFFYHPRKGHLHISKCQLTRRRREADENTWTVTKFPYRLLKEVLDLVNDSTKQ